MSAHLPMGYSVSADGKVYSASGWRGHELRELQQHTNTHGYLCVHVVERSGKRGRRLVHQLVAFYFVGPRPSPRHEVRHLDGNKTNNSAANLAWGTRKENAADREAHGRTSRGVAHAAAIKRGLPEPHNKGKTLPEEQKRKIGDAMRGRPWSPARRAAQPARAAIAEATS